jgi:hypothetical protein
MCEKVEPSIGLLNKGTTPMPYTPSPQKPLSRVPKKPKLEKLKYKFGQILPNSVIKKWWMLRQMKKIIKQYHSNGKKFRFLGENRERLLSMIHGFTHPDYVQIIGMSHFYGCASEIMPFNQCYIEGVTGAASPLSFGYHVMICYTYKNNRVFFLVEDAYITDQCIEEAIKNNR